MKTSLCDSGNEYILLSEPITIAGRGVDQASRQADERNKGVIF